MRANPPIVLVGTVGLYTVHLVLSEGAVATAYRTSFLLSFLSSVVLRNTQVNLKVRMPSLALEAPLPRIYPLCPIPILSLISKPTTMVVTHPLIRRVSSHR